MVEGESSQQYSPEGFCEVPLLPVPSSWLETPVIDAQSCNIIQTQAESYNYAAFPDFHNVLSNVELYPEAPPPDIGPQNSIIQTQTQAESYSYSYSYTTYSDFLNMLSDVELIPATPPIYTVPSPITTSVLLPKEECSGQFEKGESSGTMKKSVNQIPHSTPSDVINLVSNLGVGDREKRKREHDDAEPRRRRRSSAELHNLAERKRRNLVTQRIRALHSLVPNCHKTDRASVISDAIEYIKLLQLQRQMISMAVPYNASFMAMRPITGMGMGIYSSAYPTYFPPSVISTFQPAVSQLQFPYCTNTSVVSSNECFHVNEEAQNSSLHDNAERNQGL